MIVDLTFTAMFEIKPLPGYSVATIYVENQNKVKEIIECEHVTVYAGMFLLSLVT